MTIKFKNQRGVVLMELLVTIFLIVLMVSLLVVNYDTSNQRLEVIMTARKLVSDLRLAQSYATSAKSVGAVNNNIWGLYFDTDIGSNQDVNKQYIMFVRGDAAGDATKKKYTSSDETFRVIQLPAGITIQSLEYDASATTTANATIRFLPPNPETTIYNDSNVAGIKYIIITLKDASSNSIKKVKVNSFGLIEEFE